MGGGHNEVFVDQGRWKCVIVIQTTGRSLIECQVLHEQSPVMLSRKDVKQQVLRLNILLRREPANYLQEELEQLDDTSQLTKQTKYMEQCQGEEINESCSILTFEMQQ